MNTAEIIDLLIHEVNHRQGLSIGLVGDLGAGKTYLVKKTLEKISERFTEQVVSPTYNLCCIYQVDELEVHHLDLYRIESEDELYDADVMGSVNNPSALTFVEWVDMYPIVAQSCDILVSIEIKEEQIREYSVSRQ